MQSDPTCGSKTFPRSILVYVSSDADKAIGEDIIKLVFAQALRETFPEAHVSWVPGYGDHGCYTNLLRPFSSIYVDEFITDLYVDKGLKGILKNRHRIQEKHFDLIIDTQTTISRTLFLRSLSHQVFISRNLKFLLSDRKPPRSNLPSSPHIMDKLLALISAATGKTANARHTLDVEHCWHALAEKLLPKGSQYIGFAPGAGDRKNKGKRWPLDSFIEVACKLNEYGFIPVFLLGPHERDWRLKIKDHIGNALFPEDCELTKNKDIHGPSLLIALASKLQVAVSNCSGTGHMLAAGGVPMVSLFGPTTPNKYAPYAKKLIILRAQDYGGKDMPNIPVSAVCQAIKKLLNQ